MTAKTLAVAIPITILAVSALWVGLFGLSENAINAITKPFSRK